MKARQNYATWSKDCYSPDFKSTLSPLTKQLTNYKCVLCGAEAKITHHAFYTHKGGRDKPGFNLFPVCDKHHREAHQPKNWRKISSDPVKGRFNYPAYLERLKKGWKKYALAQKPQKPISVDWGRQHRSNGLVLDTTTAALISLSVLTFMIVVFAL